MKNLFSQQQDGFQSPNERSARALEGIWRELSIMNKRNVWTVDGLIARDVADAIKPTDHNEVNEQPKSLNELPVTQWSEKQREEVRDVLRNRKPRYPVEKNELVRRWIVWNWNNYCDGVSAYRKGELKRKPLLYKWAEEIGLVGAGERSTQTRRFLVGHGILTNEQYDKLIKVEQNEQD